MLVAFGYNIWWSNSSTNQPFFRRAEPFYGWGSNGADCCCKKSVSHFQLTEKISASKIWSVEEVARRWPYISRNCCKSYCYCLMHIYIFEAYLYICSVELNQLWNNRVTFLGFFFLFRKDMIDMQGTVMQLLNSVIVTTHKPKSGFWEKFYVIPRAQYYG